MQALLVAVIVTTAVCYAAVKLMPAGWRRTVAARAASLVVRSGLSDVFARRVEAKLASGGACGSCDSCKACAAPSNEEGDVAVFAASPSGYREIPIRRV